MEVKSIRQAISLMRSSLAQSYPAGEIEGFVRLLFEELYGYTTTQLLLNQETVLSDVDVERIKNIVERLQRYEPIQYILGSAYFGDMRMVVGKGVLIPRPETAEIVQRIIAWHSDVKGRVADLCTGSGCIAIALATAWKDARVEGWDISPEALAYAQCNSKAHKVEVEWRECDVLRYAPLAEPAYEVMISNPPYVLDSERAEMDENVLQYEPHSALFVADDEPLLFYEAIADIAIKELLPGGVLYFEINCRMGEACCRMLRSKGFEQVEVFRDFMGVDRMVRCVKKMN